MDSSLFQALLEFIGQHPLLAGMVVFLVAFTESLAIVGLFMPGAVLMFAFGMLIGGGQMDFVATMVWAMLGAVAGDGLSFWLGRHYHQRLKVMWPFRRYPALIAKGTDFFTRHGGKSILFGRFVGPVRPIIPAVAGMLEMSWPQFLLVNVASALLWAPAYLLPGMAFGASLGLAAEVAGRLVMVLLLVLAVILASVWLVRRIFYYMQPRTNPLIERSLRVTHNIPYLRAITEALLDPEHPEARVLSGLYLVLLVATVMFVVLLQLTGDAEVGEFNMAIHNLIQGLRVDWMDGVMLWLTQFGSLYFVLPFAGLLSVALLLRRDVASAAYLAALILFAQLSVVILKNVTALERPGGAFEGVHQYTFPSSHAVMATVLFGFLAVVFAGRLAPAWRWLPYTVGAAIVSVVMFSRLYLGVHWLTDLLAGLAMGLVWTALAGIAYRRHHRCAYGVGGLLGGSCLALLLGLALYAGTAPAPAYLDASPPPVTRNLGEAHWLNSAWRELPAYRQDLRGFNNHPFNLQLAGSEETIKTGLESARWQATESLRLATALRHLRAESAVEELPVPPHVHRADSQQLLFTRTLEGGQRIAVIRLWRSHLRLGEGEWIWFGNVSLMHQEEVLWFLHLLRTEADFATPLRWLSEYRAPGRCVSRERPMGETVLLCR